MAGSAVGAARSAHAMTAVSHAEPQTMALLPLIESRTAGRQNLVGRTSIGSWRCSHTHCAVAEAPCQMVVLRLSVAKTAQQIATVIDV